MPNLAMRFFLERALPGLVFFLLGLWSYALFVHVPYAGFDFNPSDGRITVVYDVSDLENALQVGDQLRQVGAITWKAFKSDFRQPLFVDQEPGQVVLLQIQRGEEKLSIRWVYPGVTETQFWARVNSEWWLAYVFWFVGTLTHLFLRPKDERWWLLCMFNFLIALWLVGGSALSRWHIWLGAIKLRVLMWGCVPIFWHLHWIFPQPLARIPASFWWLVYLVAGLLAVGEMFQLFASRFYFLAFLLAMIGSAGLLAIRFIRRPEQRRDIKLLVATAALAPLPSIGVLIVSLFGPAPVNAGGGLISLPALPLAYFYAAARRQLGDRELRANRLITLYIFLILLSTVTAILVPLAHASLAPGAAIGITLVAVLLTAMLSVMGFPPFQRWVERYLLGIPLAPEHLLASYGSQITTSLDLQSLLTLVQSKILKSLLVRQAVLLEIDDNKRCRVLGAMGLDNNPLPTDKDLPNLLEQIGHSAAPLGRRQRAAPNPPWLRVILPLQIGQETIGLWLLGRRDPDDFYAQSELVTLQAIANHTAIALTNITQAERLRTLHQTSLDRAESERTILAQDLHDVVLNQLAVLIGSVEMEVEPRFEQNYTLLVKEIRQMIQGLRPALLSYGLRSAFEELIDDLSERENAPLFDLYLSEEDSRYEASIEQHLFRIVQQVCENALRHAQAESLCVAANFSSTKVEITIEDDGIGFQTDQVLDLTYLLTNKHYGIVNMWERTEIIGAVIRIESTPQHGTTVHLMWQAPDTNHRAAQKS